MSLVLRILLLAEVLVGLELLPKGVDGVSYLDKL